MGALDLSGAIIEDATVGSPSKKMTQDDEAAAEAAISGTDLILGGLMQNSDAKFCFCCIGGIVCLTSTLWLIYSRSILVWTVCTFQVGGATSKILPGGFKLTTSIVVCYSSGILAFWSCFDFVFDGVVFDQRVYLILLIRRLTNYELCPSSTKNTFSFSVEHLSWFFGIREIELHQALPDVQDTYSDASPTQVARVWFPLSVQESSRCWWTQS